MLPIDALVTDLMFKGNAAFDQATLLDALGGADNVAKWQVIDPDMLDPRFEMELSPSRPFRARGERRLMMIDAATAPMRVIAGEDPSAGMPEPRDPSTLVPVDLRAAKEELIAICEKVPVRLGRLFALGSPGDAVWVVRAPRDLRGLALLPWVLDPTTDVDGRRRPSQLTKKEFETKVMAYEKRLEEISDAAILAKLAAVPGVNIEHRGELLIVDLLEADGTWLPLKSLQVEDVVAAVDEFSLIPGAPRSDGPTVPAANQAGARTNPAANGTSGSTSTNGARLTADAGPGPAGTAGANPSVAPSVVPDVPSVPLRVVEVGGKVTLWFPAERFDLDVAAALGKKDWDAIVRKADQLSGAQRDRLQRDGGGFIAPLEFLSEVFVEGKPLNRSQFDKEARALSGGVRALDVHFPRFGPVALLDVPGKGRFVTSLVEYATEAAALLTT